MIYDLVGFHRDAGDLADEVDYVFWVPDFVGPIVGVVDDAGSLVRLHLVAVDNPGKGGARAEHVLVCLKRDVRDGDIGVVDD